MESTGTRAVIAEDPAGTVKTRGGVTKTNARAMGSKAKAKTPQDTLSKLGKPKNLLLMAKVANSAVNLATGSLDLDFLEDLGGGDDDDFEVDAGDLEDCEAEADYDDDVVQEDEDAQYDEDEDFTYEEECYEEEAYPDDTQEQHYGQSYAQPSTYAENQDILTDEYYAGAYQESYADEGPYNQDGNGQQDWVQTVPEPQPMPESQAMVQEQPTVESQAVSEPQIMSEPQSEFQSQPGPGQEPTMESQPAPEPRAGPGAQGTLEPPPVYDSSYIGSSTSTETPYAAPSATEPAYPQAPAAISEPAYTQPTFEDPSTMESQSLASSQPGYTQVAPQVQSESVPANDETLAEAQFVPTSGVSQPEPTTEAQATVAQQPGTEQLATELLPVMEQQPAQPVLPVTETQIGINGSSTGQYEEPTCTEQAPYHQEQASMVGTNDDVAQIAHETQSINLSAADQNLGCESQVGGQVGGQEQAADRFPQDSPAAIKGPCETANAGQQQSTQMQVSENPTTAGYTGGKAQRDPPPGFYYDITSFSGYPMYPTQ
jgi:hypothetical protein